MGLKVRQDDDDDLPIDHAINLTPFIDVMLVLLVIFMIVAPLATVDAKVDLPASTARPVPRPDKPIVLTVKADKTWMLGDEAVTEASIGPALDKASRGDREQRVYLRADKTVDYDTLMKAMNGLRAAGYLKVALVGLEAGQTTP